MTTSPLPDPCTPQHIRGADGARLGACAHGGHLLSWVPAGEDRDRLWLSPLSRCSPGEAIRGGIPVIFPQFAGRGPLPKHGLARNREWELSAGTAPDGAALVTGTLTADDATRAVWPHDFTLTLRAEAAGPSLTTTLTVRNDGTAPFTLTAALHSYLTADAATAAVHGVGGLTAEDNAAGGAPRVLPEGPLATAGPVDLAVRGTAGPVRLADGLGGLLEVRGTEGVDSLVVWNPGTPHGLGDVPPEGAHGFVCVEPARLEAVEVGPGGSFTLQAVLTALVPDARPAPEAA